MGIPWGTNSRVQFLEPEFGFPLSVGASGEMALAVREPKKLLLKLVGTEALLSQQKLIDYFKSFLQTRIKTAIAQVIPEKQLSIFQMDAQLTELSEEVKARLKPDFAEYGLELTQMMVTTVVRPEGDPIYEQFKQIYFRQYADVRNAQIDQQVGVIEQETEAKRTVIEAQAIAQKRSVEGYTYQQERGFDVAQQMAKNEAVGEFANMGIGLGMMTGVGGPMSTVVGGAVSQAVGEASMFGAVAAPAPAAPAEQTVTPPAPSAVAGLSKFCPECGFSFVGEEKFCPQCGKKRG